MTGEGAFWERGEPVAKKKKPREVEWGDSI
jgi:hypothetical protein